MCFAESDVGTPPAEAMERYRGTPVAHVHRSIVRRGLGAVLAHDVNGQFFLLDRLALAFGGSHSTSARHVEAVKSSLPTFVRSELTATLVMFVATHR
jgi:hypothetical protein